MVAEIYYQAYWKVLDGQTQESNPYEESEATELWRSWQDERRDVVAFALAAAESRGCRDAIRKLAREFERGEHERWSAEAAKPRPIAGTPEREP